MSEINLNEAKVSTAIKALFHVAQNKEEKKSLLETVNDIELQICLKKIPAKSKTIKLKLPHSTYRQDLDVCLFVKDLDFKDREYEKTVNHTKDLLKQKGVNCVTDIIPVKSLRTEYKPFEAKKNLSNAYDIFLADSRIFRFLPKLLGKHFFGKKKIPCQVNLLAKDLVKEFSSAVGNSTCIISSKGASSTATIGHLNMTEVEVMDNVLAAATQVSSGIPGSSSNIKQLYLKTKSSLSIPIYLSQGGPQDITLPKDNKVHEKIEAEELSTMLDVKVKVYPNGHIKIIQDKPEGSPAKKKKMTKTSTKKKSVAKVV